MIFHHTPIMPVEVIDGLNIKKDGVYVDCTLGGGGHSFLILQKLSGSGKLIANDLDLDAIAASKERLKKYLDKITFIHGDYKDICDNLKSIGICEVDGILIDMGVSSYQIDNFERGFSYRADGVDSLTDCPLDMRMNRAQSLSAYEVVNEYSEKGLLKILYEYGEEKFAKKIVSAIIKARSVKPIETTAELSKLIVANYPVGFKDGHPAKKTFQAIRIEVNGELEGLQDALYNIIDILKKGARLATLTFHSLEDRTVKTVIKDLERGCTCDKSLPVCVCNKKPVVKLITKKPLTATPQEIALNKRAASAKLRIIEKL